MRLGNRIEDRARLGEIAGGERKPGDETDVVRLAIIEHVLAAAIDKIVAVLHGRHLEHLGRGLDVGNRYLAQAGVPDDAVIEHRSDRGELLLARDLRINAMQLPEPDLLDAELLAAPDRLLAEIARVSIGLPACRDRDA